MPRRAQSEHQKEKINCGPLSEVITTGTPKRLIQDEKSARAQSEEDVEDRGIASGQRVVLSIIVSK